ncbi:MAG: hypothetical protein WD425_00090 [Nitrospirales bacterium]
MQQLNRLLTYDEKKAAEAAFKGSPIDPKWSESARKVYIGLSSAMANQRNEAFQEVRLLQVTTIAKRAVPESKEMSEMICREEH